MIYIIISILIIFLLIYLFTYYRYKKNNIGIKFSIYSVLHDNDSYCYLTSYINGSSINFKLIFNNCIYIFNNYQSTINNYYYPYQYDMEINNTTKINSDKMIYDFTECGQGYYNNFEHIFCKINDINKIKKIKKNKKKKIKKNKKKIIISINLQDFIIDLCKDNYILYNNFINIFNNTDKNIIKVGAYGDSGCGKTYFIRNIKKIIFKDIDRFDIFYYNTNKDLYENNGILPIKYISRLILNTHYIYFIIYLSINIDDPCFNKIFNKIMHILNTNKSYVNIKIIFLCDSYTNIFTDFDIVYHAKYQNIINVY